MPKTRLTAALCSRKIDTTSSTSPPSKAASAGVSPAEKAAEEVLPSVCKTGNLSPQLAKTCTTNARSKNSSDTDLVQVSQQSPALPPPSLPPHPVRRRLPNSSAKDYHVWDDVTESSPSDSESDSDQDLPLPDMLSCPDVFETLPKKGDAVWVKHRNYNFWPCLVLSSNHKTKKINVLFMDQVNGIELSGNGCTRMHLRYNRKKVLPFNHQNRKQLEAEGSSLGGEMQKSFQAALLNMEDYLTKRALGHATPFHHLLGISFTSTSGLADNSTSNASLGEGASLAKHKVKQEESSPLSCTADTTTSGDKCLKIPRKRPLTPVERREKRKKINEPLVEYICAEDMKDYLFKIWKGDILSERHQKFFKGQKERRELQEMTFGPIDDDGQLDKIVEKLGGWFHEASGEQIINMDYLFGVWVPEAIVKGLCKFKKVGATKAWECFRQGVKLTKLERKEIHDTLLGRKIQT